jgi:hypothetical protein
MGNLLDQLQANSAKAKEENKESIKDRDEMLEVKKALEEKLAELKDGKVDN